MSGKFRTWTCCCRFQSISTVVLIKAEESIIKTCSTLQIIKYERKQIGWHRQQQVWKVWIVFSGLFNGSLTWCWGHSCRFCVRRTFTQSRLSHMKMKSVQHLSIMAFVIHSLASSSYFTPFFQVFGFGFLEPQNEKKDKQKYFFFMRKKQKYFDAKYTCLRLSWARVCLSYILVLEGLIKKIRCLRGLMKE